MEITKIKTPPVSSPWEILMTSLSLHFILLQRDTPDSPDIWLTGRISYAVTLQLCSWAVLASGNELQDRSEVRIAKWPKSSFEFLGDKGKKPAGGRHPRAQSFLFFYPFFQWETSVTEIIAVISVPSQLESMFCFDGPQGLRLGGKTSSGRSSQTNHVFKKKGGSSECWWLDRLGMWHIAYYLQFQW